MNINRCCFVSTNEQAGGAGIAAWRLFENVHQRLPESRYLVSRKTSKLEQVIGAHDALSYLKPRLRSRMEKAHARLQGWGGETMFSPAHIQAPSVIDKINALNPDIVHLNWINSAFLAIEDLQYVDAPLVWTLHDQWPFTGGCHYTAGCTNWLHACGQCPQLSKSSHTDLSNKVFTRKASNWPKLDLTIVAPSQWLASLARQSPLLEQFPVHVIPNGLDTVLYSPQDKCEARQLLRLPQNKSLALFGAIDAMDDQRKGFDLLADGLARLPMTMKTQLELVVFGNRNNKLQEQLEYKVNFLGRIEDEHKLSKIYSAADFFIAPSRQDNLPNTCIEAMACGTPVIAFDIGGMPEIVKHQQTGYLVEAFNTRQIASAIEWLINALKVSNNLELAARSHAEKNYDQAMNAGHYLSLYQQILDSRKQ